MSQPTSDVRAAHRRAPAAAVPAGKVLDWQQTWPPISLACKNGQMDQLGVPGEERALLQELEALDDAALRERAIADLTRRLRRRRRRRRRRGGGGGGAAGGRPAALDAAQGERRGSRRS